MKILYLVGRELNYPRNDVILQALRCLGTVKVIGEYGSSSLLSRNLRIALKTIPHLFTDHYDLVFVGFYGHFLMLLVGLLSRWPILFDIFVSTYDTLCFDRKILKPNSIGGRLAFWLDKTTCHLANHILVDTEHHAKYFSQTFNLPPNCLHSVPVGCNEKIFYPRLSSRQDNVTHVFYYSTYLPLHGVETIVRAAALLSSEPIHFRLIGNGPEYNQVRYLATQLKLKNTTFIPRVPLEILSQEIADADICLGGHFGLSHKASRVVPGKVYQFLAMARPLIATNTPANQALLLHGETAYLCPRADPEELALAILRLHQDPKLRNHLAVNGRNLFISQCSQAVITERLRHIINDLPFA